MKGSNIVPTRVILMHNKDISISLSTVLFYSSLGTLSTALQLLFAGKISDFHIAILTSIYWTLSLIFSPIWSIIADRTKRMLMIICFNNIALSIVILSMYLYENYWTIFAFRAITGIFASAFLPIALALLLEGTPKDKLGRKSSLFNLSRSMGFLLSSYATSAILLFFNVPVLFIYSSFTVFITVITISIARKSLCTTKVKNSLDEKINLPGSGFIKNKNAHILVIALSIRHLNIMGLISIIYAIMLKHGIPNHIASAISSFNLLVQIFTIHFFGYLSDRYGRKLIFNIGFGFSALVPLLFMLAMDYIGFILAFVMLGFGFSALISGVSPYLKDIAPEGREAEALSFLNISRSIGSIIGPILVGGLATLFGYNIMFLTISGISFFAFILSLFVKE